MLSPLFFDSIVYYNLTVSALNMNKLFLFLFLALLASAKRKKALDRTKQAYNNYYTSKKFEDFSKNFKTSLKGLYLNSKDGDSKDSFNMPKR